MLKTGKREISSSIPGRACLPSRSEFSVIFLRILSKYGLGSLWKTPTDGTTPVGPGEQLALNLQLNLTKSLFGFALVVDKNLILHVMKLNYLQIGFIFPSLIIIFSWNRNKNVRNLLWQHFLQYFLILVGTFKAKNFKTIFIKLHAILVWLLFDYNLQKEALIVNNQNCVRLNFWYSNICYLQFDNGLGHIGISSCSWFFIILLWICAVLIH